MTAVPVFPTPAPARLARAVGIALCSIGAMTATPLSTAQAQTQAVEARVAHDIPAGALGPALTRYAAGLGLTLSFTPELVAGKRTDGLRGAHTTEEGFSRLLAGSGLAWRMEDARSVRLLPAATTEAQVDDGVIRPGSLSVSGNRLPNFVSDFGGRSIADSGTTTVAGAAYRARIEGDGDANSVLRGMANVQYQNDMGTDTGVDGQREIDMRPLEVSISGGKLYENNFRINGVGVNNLTGSIERSPLASSPCGVDPMPDYSECAPDYAMMYGLHSQTVFVPDAFVESVTVVDSNASARYGDFQGGVVDYKLADPTSDRVRATFDYDRTDSDWVDYKLVGNNTYNRLPPDFDTDKYAMSVNIPVTASWALGLAYSQKDASSRKQRNVQFLNDEVLEDDARNRYFRLASRHETDAGRFVFDASYTDYENSFQNVNYIDSAFDVRTKGLTSQLRHEIDLDGLRWERAGFGDVSIVSRLTYNDSYVHNRSEGDVVYTPYIGTTTRVSGQLVTWESDLLADSCRHVVTSTTGIGTSTCNYGGFGEREQGQTELGFSTELSADLFGGRFDAGLSHTRAEASRTRLRDAYFYSTWRTLYSAYGANYVDRSFICADGDQTCTPEQYATTGVWHPAFDIEVDVAMSNAWLEWDRSFGKFALRTGLRFDHEDYFGNFNTSPRIVLSWTPMDTLALSVGANRYYNASSLAYAIRDAQPSQVVSSRTANLTTGIVNNDWTPGTQRTMSYLGSDLDTPYVDEYTASLQWNDPWLDGSLRLRWMQRNARDQFATVAASTTARERTLTNNGRGQYESASLEYRKSWAGLPVVDRLGMSFSTTWSKQSRSSDTYFDDDGETSADDFIWYHERGYTRATFGEVTGNLDIPLRATLVLTTDWFDGRLQLATSLNHNLPYDGVQDSGEDITVDGRRYNVYEDHLFASTTTAGLSGSWRIWDGDTTGLSVRFNVNNLFNDLGNGRATAAAPWKRGRSFWAGVALRF